MLELKGIGKVYRSGLLGRNPKKVLDDVTLNIDAGQIVGLVGESGSGKTTLARIALHLIPATQGTILLDDVDVTHLKERRFRMYRKDVQIVFQHPEGALDPKLRLGDSIKEALIQTGVKRAKLAERMGELCAEVNLPPELLHRYPGQVSGGEIQRAALCRALAFKPRYLILDEPTSMLDVSVQAHILNLVKEFVKTNNSGALMISHDLDVMRAMCGRLAVLAEGRLIEEGHTEKVLDSPASDRTKSMMTTWREQDAVLDGNADALNLDDD